MKALNVLTLRDCVIIQKYIYRVYLWRRGGLMVSAHDSGASCLSSSPGRGLKQDTLLSQCLSPPRCINGHGQIVGET